MPYLTWIALLLIGFLGYGWVFDHGQIHPVRLVWLAVISIALLVIADII